MGVLHGLDIPCVRENHCAVKFSPGQGASSIAKDKVSRRFQRLRKEPQVISGKTHAPADVSGL
jgi:hypothetical protein